MTDLHTAEPTLEAFGDCLRKLANDSTPENRPAKHLLHLDLNDTWRFAYRHPSALSISDAA